jgi:hypothetical protein
LRKLLSILLLATFALPLLAAIPALASTPESRLPACCRRNGAHKCMLSAEQMAALEHGQHFTTPRSTCPMFPKAVAPAHSESYALAPSAAFYAGVSSHPAQFQQVEAWARVALEGARHKRGPPAVRLS